MREGCVCLGLTTVSVSNRADEGLQTYNLFRRCIVERGSLVYHVDS